MTPPEIVRRARAKMGLSAAKFAEALRDVSELPINDRTVRRWESDEGRPPGPVLLLCRIWTDKRCPQWAKPKS